MKLVSAFLIGAIFGLGIVLGGMINPAKVLNFFDIAGSWDPSLIFVMGGALLTAALGYRIVFGVREKPVLEADFKVPDSQTIDRYLIGGSAVFGIGWGIAGFCPGGSLPALGLGYIEPFQFVAAMITGILIARLIKTRVLQPADAKAA